MLMPTIFNQALAEGFGLPTTQIGRLGIRAPPLLFLFIVIIPHY